MTAAEEAHSKVAGLGDNAVHTKYVELVRTYYLNVPHDY